MYLQINKTVNLRIAAKKLNGFTIAPGQVFSYWKAIGKPTKCKGYLKGMVLKNGGFYEATGGGLCQMSNLIYWMTIHTPLTVIERHRHDFDVFPDSNRTQPFGSGATCFYNYGDLMIRNDTAQVFRLSIKVGEKNLEGHWQSDLPLRQTYTVYEKEHFIQPEFWGGYSRHNKLYRKIHDSSGTEIDDEFLVENHALMSYTPLLEGQVS
jgi:vancomycin resistance protein VanW